MKNIIFKRKCPVCGNGEGALLHHQSFVLPLDFPLPDNYNITFCNQCGFVFADTSAKQKNYSKYYEIFSKYEDKTSVAASGGYVTSWEIDRFSTTAEYLCGFINDYNQKIIDIGCANGGLLFKLKNLGYKNLFGIDPSNLCVKNVREFGIPCEQADFFNDSVILKDKKFDVIIFSHVLEHIYDLHKAVSLLQNILTDQGIIYVEIPDASRYNDFYITPFHFFDIEHINHFDEYHVDLLFNKHGLKVNNYSKKEIFVSKNNRYPVLSFIIKKEKVIKFNDRFFYKFLSEQISKYIEKSRLNDNYPEVAKVALQRDPVIIWGAGSYASRLLQNSVLGKCNIKAIVDKDLKKHNTELNGIKIFHPEYLLDFFGIIIICSALYSDNILEDISKMGLKNKILVMK